MSQSRITLPAPAERSSWAAKLHVSAKRAGVSLAVLATLAGAGLYGYRYWTIGRFLESTDDAFLKADYTTVAPKVSGYIAEVLVADNQPVRAGQVLARIDDRDFRTAIAQAKANVAAAEADIRNLDARLDLQQSVVAEAAANVTAAVPRCISHTPTMAVSTTSGRSAMPRRRRMTRPRPRCARRRPPCSAIRRRRRWHVSRSTSCRLSAPRPRSQSRTARRSSARPSST